MTGGIQLGKGGGLLGTGMAAGRWELLKTVTADGTSNQLNVTGIQERKVLWILFQGTNDAAADSTITLEPMAGFVDTFNMRSTQGVAAIAADTVGPAANCEIGALIKDGALTQSALSLILHQFDPDKDKTGFYEMGCMDLGVTQTVYRGAMFIRLTGAYLTSFSLYTTGAGVHFKAGSKVWVLGLSGI